MRLTVFLIIDLILFVRDATVTTQETCAHLRIATYVFDAKFIAIVLTTVL